MSGRIQNLNNNEQMNRYARQTSLPEIGEAGQEKLRNAKVLIVGVGGLGSPIALYLAGAGVGTLGLVDDDQVSISNLQRQVLYAEADVGESKPLCGARRVQGLNSDVNVEVYPFRLDKKNAGELIRNYDIVVDGCDNFATRYLLNDVCNAWGKPYVYGAFKALKAKCPSSATVRVQKTIVTSIRMKKGHCSCHLRTNRLSA